MIKILVVEDEKPINDLIPEQLRILRLLDIFKDCGGYLSSIYRLKITDADHVEAIIPTFTNASDSARSVRVKHPVV